MKLLFVRKIGARGKAVWDSPGCLTEFRFGTQVRVGSLGIKYPHPWKAEA